MNTVAQLSDSLGKAQPKHLQLFKKFAVPVTFIAAGIYGTTDNSIINHNEIREERFEYFSRFSHKADNYLQFAPVVTVYAIDAIGLKSRHNWQKQTVLLGRAQLIMMAFVMPLKKLTNITRPDSSASNSFPSGHTAQAFMGATFFAKEYGNHHPWATVGMYTLATGIGVFRMLNNRHWVSDVLAGAGFGILSTELSYLLQRKKVSHRKMMPDVLVPGWQHGNLQMVALYHL